MKKVSKSQAYLLYRVQVTTEAVLTVPELRQVFAKHTYHPKKVREGQQLLDRVQELQVQQELAYENARKTQRNLHQGRQTMRTLYVNHLEAARFVYRRDEAMQK